MLQLKPQQHFCAQVRDVPRLDRAPVGFGAAMWAGYSSESAGANSVPGVAAGPAIAMPALRVGFTGGADAGGDWQPEMQARPYPACYYPRNCACAVARCGDDN